MRTKLLLLAAIITLCLTGCAPNADQRIAASIADLIRADMKDPSAQQWSPRNRELLEQAVKLGEITLAMYDESALDYQQCIADLGTSTNWVKKPDGMYSEDPPLDMDDTRREKSLHDAEICAAAGFAEIEAVFSLQLYNPGLYDDPFEAIYVCINSRGDYLHGITLEQFREELAAVFSPPHDQPTHIDPTIPEVNECLIGNGIVLLVAD